MANYENIRRYSEVNHEMAQAGGVDAFLEDQALANFQAGVDQERHDWIFKLLIVVPALLLIFSE